MTSQPSGRAPIDTQAPAPVEEHTAGGGPPAAAPPAPPGSPGGPPIGASTRRFKTFDSLIDVPAFRWYLLSMSGNWSALQMQQVARSYLAYQLTGSYAALGVVELANTWPRLFLALYGGVVADRMSRRIIIQVGQAVNALNAGAIAVLLFTGLLEFWHLIAMSFLQGILNSFVLPARQAMIPEVVGPNRLMNAFALNVFVLNVVRLGAPAIAGGIIAALMVSTGQNVFVSVGVVFALMALLNVFAVVGLFPVPRTDARTRAALVAATEQGAAAEAAPAPRRRRGGGGGDGEGGGALARTGLKDIKDAFVYLKGEHVIIWLMVIHSSTAMLSLPYQRLLPGFVEQVLGYTPDNSAAVMGLLLSMTAIGALIGSLLIASLPDRRRGKILAYSLALFGITLIAFSASTVLWISAGVVLLLGIGQSIRQSIANILIQSRVEEVYRGRISAIMLLDDGLESLGIFGIALMADYVGAPWALGFVGALMIVYAVVIWLTRRIRDLD
jgi:MFS family permease